MHPFGNKTSFKLSVIMFLYFPTVVLICVCVSGNASPVLSICRGSSCNTNRSSSGPCILPPAPENAIYTNLEGNALTNTTTCANGASIKISCNTTEGSFNTRRATCINGAWSDLLDCGEPSDRYLPATQHIIGGRYSRARQFPWHVGIYFKGASGNELPIQVCGGTIYNSHSIITAAHCFYTGADDEPQDKNLYSIVADKIHRDWFHADDANAQYSEIKELHIPESYLDWQGNYADDIAVLVLESPLFLTTFAPSVQVEWSHTGLEVIPPGSMGTVAGWGLTEEDGASSTELKFISIPTVTRHSCQENSPKDFRKYLTYDKFCAGLLNGSSVCRGDSGGGLIYKKNEGRSLKTYLRGVVSVGPPKGSTCDSHKFTAFTSIVLHLDWLRSVIVEELSPPIRQPEDLSHNLTIRAFISGESLEQHEANYYWHDLKQRYGII